VSVAVDKPKSGSRKGQGQSRTRNIEKVFDHGEKKYVLVVGLDERGNVNAISVKVREYPIYPYSNFVDHELRIERRGDLTVEYSTCSDSWGSPGCNVSRVKFKRFREVAEKTGVFNPRRYEEIKTFSNFIDAVENIARFVVELVKNSRELEYAKRYGGKVESYIVLENLEDILNGVEDIIHMLGDPLLYEDLSKEISKLKTQLIT